MRTGWGRQILSLSADKTVIKARATGGIRSRAVVPEGEGWPQAAACRRGEHVGCRRCGGHDRRVGHAAAQLTVHPLADLLRWFTQSDHRYTGSCPCNRLLDVLPSRCVTTESKGGLTRVISEGLMRMRRLASAGTGRRGRITEAPDCVDVCGMMSRDVPSPRFTIRRF
jgi:hypothetical protein